jgi:hypothetical protein
MVDKTPEKINLSGASKNMLFVPLRYVQHKLKIQKNMEKHYPWPIKGLKGICQIISVFSGTGQKSSLTKHNNTLVDYW